MHQPENCLEVALRTADPHIAKVSELHDGHGRLTGKALDEKSLPGTDRTADQIALRHGLEIPSLPEGQVLSQPLLERLHAVHIVERPVRLQELDEPVAVDLHASFLQTGELAVRQRLASILDLSGQPSD